MRISDWSSDVCSSDLPNIAPARPLAVDLLEAAVRHQALEAMLDELVRRHARQLPQRIGKRPAKLTRHGGRIAVGAAHGLVDDPVDQPKLFKADRKSTRLNSSH